MNEYICFRSWDSLVNTMTAARFPAWAGLFFLATASRSALRAHQAFCPVGSGVISPAVKRRGHEPEHTNPSRDEV
jgi:hypothetical protein